MMYDIVMWVLLTNTRDFHLVFSHFQRDILINIKEHLLYLDSNHIEMVVLLCDKLFDEERLGITYKEIKQSTRLMDIIELGRTKDDADIEHNYDHHDPVGYAELLQVLQNFLWSNVDINEGLFEFSRDFCCE